MRLLPLLPLVLAGCLARAEEPVRYECTSFPVRSTAAMGAFQAPTDLGNAKINATALPPGWVPMGGSVGEGGAFVLACKTGP